MVDEKGKIVQDSGLLLWNGGLVCSTSFYTNEAVAICRELGFNVNGAKAYNLDGSWKIQRKLQVKMHSVDCTESKDWEDCEFKGRLHKKKCRTSHVHLTCDGELDY